MSSRSPGCVSTNARYSRARSPPALGIVQLLVVDEPDAGLAAAERNDPAPPPVAAEVVRREPARRRPAGVSAGAGRAPHARPSMSRRSTIVPSSCGRVGVGPRASEGRVDARGAWLRPRRIDDPATGHLAGAPSCSNRTRFCGHSSSMSVTRAGPAGRRIPRLAVAEICSSILAESSWNDGRRGTSFGPASPISDRRRSSLSETRTEARASEGVPARARRRCPRHAVEEERRPRPLPLPTF